MTSNILTLVQNVRNAVLEGDFALLSTLLPALQESEAKLEKSDLVALGALRIEAVRTENCLLSALSGVRAARRRVADVAQAANGLTTYDRGGVKATLPSVIPDARRV